MKAADIMTRRVLTIRDNATLHDAARLMVEQRISGVPVVDVDGVVVGILSEGDLLRRSETGTLHHRPRWLEFLLGPGKLAQEYSHTHGRTVEEVMTRRLFAVTPDTPLEKVVELMERQRIKRVPVLLDGLLVGIISRANLVQALEALIPTMAQVESDDAIRQQLWDELDKTGWAPLIFLSVVVHDGVVDLNGTITDPRQSEALRILAENVPGVKEVRDHLVWVDAATGTVAELPEQEAGQDPKQDSPLPLYKRW